MPNLVGIGNSQVPTNAMLGGLAYQDSVGNIDIEKIKAKTSDTAKDIFVYDTSKDSDGGAWRHRTQNTSWYNEGASSIRGARKEFPAVAIIVVETSQVTIYDADDPNCPMWMVFNQSMIQLGAMVGYTGFSIGCCTMVNGILMVGMDASNQANVAGLRLINFISEHFNWKANITGRHSSQHWPIVDRNGGRPNVNVDSNLIINEVINVVDAIVLPNAPIDASTGLPTPTIVIGTNGGVSVIKDDGTVADITNTNSGYNYVTQIKIDEKFVYMGFGASNLYIGGIGYAVPIPSADVSLGNIVNATTNANFRWNNNSTSGSGGQSDYYINPSDSNADDVNGMVLTKSGMSFGTETGSSILLNDQRDGNGSVAFITSSFNSGYMHGDIKGAYLADTSTDNINNTNLVSNGTFDSNINGWNGAGSGGTATASYDSGRLKLVSSAGNQHVHTTVTCEVGKKYYFQADFQGHISFHLSTQGDAGNDRGYIPYSNYGSSTTRHLFFTATQTTMYIVPYVIGTNNVGYVDNVIVRLADHDRSISGARYATFSGTSGLSSGLNVNGTVSRAKVATGADLVYYSGFSGSNYLQQPYNSALDFGTGDLSIIFWYKLTSTGTPQCFIHRGDGGSGTWGSGAIIQIEMDTSHIEFQLSASAFSSYDEAEVSVDVAATGQWQHFVGVRKDGRMHVYIDGVKYGNTASTRDLSNTSAKLWVGQRPNASRPLSNGSMALLRMSSSAPSEEQVTKMYHQEKKLFQENAKCTLYGTSDAVTALAYDDSNNVLHAGTSSGRSEFQGLVRINNTTTAVTTAISASNGLVAEQ